MKIPWLFGRPDTPGPLVAPWLGRTPGCAGPVWPGRVRRPSSRYGFTIIYSSKNNDLLEKYIGLVRDYYFHLISSSLLFYMDGKVNPHYFNGDLLFQSCPSIWGWLYINIYTCNLESLQYYLHQYGFGSWYGITIDLHHYEFWRWFGSVIKLLFGFERWIFDDFEGFKTYWWIWMDFWW